MICGPNNLSDIYTKWNVLLTYGEVHGMILSLDGYLTSRRGTVDGITGEHADGGRRSDQIPVWMPEWDSNISFDST